ncbi:MAG: hypothetical protein LBT97_08490 [Planctomycetota bacterium]|jgi:hypothetical protein|nr:hypothetical protein [Planctomycetota bacterium]
MFIRQCGLAAILALLLGAGCREPYADGGNREVPFHPGERQGDVTLYRDLQFEDLPVPAEYTIVGDKSHSFQGSRFRTGVFHYAGPLDWRSAIDFYRSQTPLSSWELVNSESGSGFRLMRYRKGPEQLIVVIRDLGGGWSRGELQLDNVERNDLLLRGRLKTEP